MPTPNSNKSKSGLLSRRHRALLASAAIFSGALVFASPSAQFAAELEKYGG